MWERSDKQGIYCRAVTTGIVASPLDRRRQTNTSRCATFSLSPSSVSLRIFHGTVRFLMNVRLWVSSVRVAAVQLVTLGFYSVLCYCVLLLIQCMLSSGPFAAASSLLPSCRSSRSFF